MKLKIFTPLLYLKLKNRSLITYTWFIPIILALIISVFALFLPKSMNVYEDNTPIRSINQLLSILVPFYIVSLAAIATFKSDILDAEISGESITLTVKRSGQEVTENLTRRRFLCFLFAYCAFISLAIFCIGELAKFLTDYLNAVKNDDSVWEIIKCIFIFCYAFAIGNLFSTTLLGLHHLADRIHRP